MAVFPKESNAVTMTLIAVPAVAVLGALTERCVAAAGLTEIEPLVPVIELLTVSFAVTVCSPAVFNVTENVPTPLVSAASEGRVAKPSVLVKCTVPV